MASPTQWTWVWVDSGSWWWTGRPGMLLFMGWKRWLNNWTELSWLSNLFWIMLSDRNRSIFLLIQTECMNRSSLEQLKWYLSVKVGRYGFPCFFVYQKHHPQWTLPLGKGKNADHGLCAPWQWCHLPSKPCAVPSPYSRERSWASPCFCNLRKTLFSLSHLAKFKESDKECGLWMLHRFFSWLPVYLNLLVTLQSQAFNYELLMAYLTGDISSNLWRLLISFLLVITSASYYMESFSSPLDPVNLC